MNKSAFTSDAGDTATSLARDDSPAEAAGQGQASKEAKPQDTAKPGIGSKPGVEPYIIIGKNTRRWDGLKNCRQGDVVWFEAGAKVNTNYRKITRAEAEQLGATGPPKIKRPTMSGIQQQRANLPMGADVQFD